MSSEAIPRHRMGKDGPSVPAIGFGLMNMSHGTYGSIPSDEENLALLDYACGRGQTFWDTSDLYGANEALLGKWFKNTGKRNEIFLATKFGYVKGSKTLEINTSASYCKAACAESLRLLGVDCIDLYYVHNANPETPIEETIRALVELKEEGKIKYIGLSTISSNTLRRAYKVAPVTAVQIEYSLFTQDIEGPSGTDLLATCRELGVAVVCSSPLSRGILSGRFSEGKLLTDETDMRSKIMPRFQDGNREHNEKIVAGLQSFADKKGCSVSQLSLAWLLKQGDDIFPIPGTTKQKHLEDNLAALDINLTDEEEAEIRASMEQVEIAGWVVPDAYKSFIFRDTKEE